MAGPDWTRPRWSRDEASAMVLYFVFGQFAAGREIDLSARGGPGLPQGVTAQRFPKAVLAHWEGHPLRGALGELLREGNRDAFKAARDAPECLALRGELTDSDSLTYLRDTLNVVTGLLGAGGVAVADPQILEIFSPGDWRARYAGDALAEPRNHVVILCNDDMRKDVAQWIHTRGMRKFARPDISIRGVPPTEVQRAGALAARLVELQARGLRLGDGSTVDVEGVPGGLRVTRGGSVEDPDFNNTHIELVWPRPGE